MKKLIFVIATAVTAFAQNNIVPQVTGNYYRQVGGSTTWYYWIQAILPNGRGPLSNAASFVNAPAALTALDHVGLNWTSIPGATGYDVLRNSTGTTPAGACNCAIAQNISKTDFDDQGAATANYTVSPSSATYSVYGNITLANINAGLTIVPGITSRAIVIHHFTLQAIGGAATACTLVELADTAGTPVVGVSVTIADLTQSTIVNEASGTGVTLTTFLAGLTAGQGLQIIKTGSACTTMTSMNYEVIYSYN